MADQSQEVVEIINEILDDIQAHKTDCPYDPFYHDTFIEWLREKIERLA
jgi:hypothetical protein